MKLLGTIQNGLVYIPVACAHDFWKKRRKVAVTQLINEIINECTWCTGSNPLGSQSEG